jgi:hypothetical protein
MPPYPVPTKTANPTEIWLKDSGMVHEISTVTLTISAIGDPTYEHIYRCYPLHGCRGQLAKMRRNTEECAVKVCAGTVRLEGDLYIPANAHVAER